MAVEEVRLEAVARSSAGEKEEQKDDETPQGTCLDGAKRGSLWLCYTRPLDEKCKEWDLR